MTTITPRGRDQYRIIRRFDLTGGAPLQIVEQVSGDENAPRWERATIQPVELEITYTWEVGREGTAEAVFAGLRVQADGSTGTLARGTVQQHRQPEWLRQAIEEHAPDGWRPADQRLW